MKRRAFTLSELLVVVVIIGVLSAVVLPKYSKVIETRKTTEAEELMSAVRTEQEARCTLNRSYTNKRTQLASIAKLQAGSTNPQELTTKDYKYQLASVGMEARRLQVGSLNSYTLKMPSYADGRICCEGAGCNKLTKNYPLCSDLTDTSKTPDYVVGNQNCEVEVCTGEECYENPTPNPEPEECSNKNEHTAGTVTETDSEGCTVSTTWTFTDYPTCTWDKTEIKSDCPSNECDPNAKPATEKECGCGYKQTRSVKCDASTNYQWEIQVGSNYGGTGGSTDAEGWNGCGKPRNGSTRKEECPTVQAGSGSSGETEKSYEIWTWSDDVCDYIKTTQCPEPMCTAPGGIQSRKLADCPELQTGSGTWEYWDSESCSYKSKTDCHVKQEMDCFCEHYYFDTVVQGLRDNYILQVGSGGSGCLDSVTWGTSIASSAEQIRRCFCPQEESCRSKMRQWSYGYGTFPGVGECNFDCILRSTDGSVSSWLYSIGRFSCKCRRI